MYASRRTPCSRRVGGPGADDCAGDRVVRAVPAAAGPRCCGAPARTRTRAGSRAAGAGRVATPRIARTTRSAARARPVPAPPAPAVREARRVRPRARQRRAPADRTRRTRRSGVARGARIAARARSERAAALPVRDLSFGSRTGTRPMPVTIIRCGCIPFRTTAFDLARRSARRPVPGSGAARRRSPPRSGSGRSPAGARRACLRRPRAGCRRRNLPARPVEGRAHLPEFSVEARRSGTVLEQRSRAHYVRCAAASLTKIRTGGERRGGLSR